VPDPTAQAYACAVDELLFRRWMHSREEDAGDLRVYRPEGYDLPPARGRRGLEFRPDGELVVYGPGPADKPQAEPGRWEPAGERRARVRLPAAGEPRELEIVSVEPDRLTLRWS
jgi:hypothetical protein